MGWIRFLRGAALCMIAITGLSATAQSAEESSWTPEQILRTVQELEPMKSPSTDQKRLTRLSRLASERLAHETGIHASSNRSPRLSRSQEINIWIRALNERQQEQRCDLVRLAYAQALSRLALMKEGNKHLDVDRALHELRLFWALAPDAPYAPRNCMDPMAAHRSIASEAQARIFSIEHRDSTF